MLTANNKMLTAKNNMPMVGSNVPMVASNTPTPGSNMPTGGSNMLTSSGTITSAAGLISLLDEDDPQLQEFALRKLNAIVDDFWPEISGAVDKIEALYEDRAFQRRDLAALVASKVFYHLDSFENALNYALGAGKYFDGADGSEYAETIVSKCVDHYTRLRVENDELPEGEGQRPIDPRLEAIVNRMLEGCQDRPAVGIALETRRLDKFRETVERSQDRAGLLAYSLRVCTSGAVHSKRFRGRVLRVLVELYEGLERPDLISVCQCLIHLHEPQKVAAVLEKLACERDEEDVLTAYQICFDLYESAGQQFLSVVIQNLQASSARAHAGAVSPAAGRDTGDATTETSDANEKDKADEEQQTIVAKMVRILGGEAAIELHLHFLVRNNNADLAILKRTKDAVRNSVCHTATVIANAYMHCGTTSDQFLRENLEWLARATNWAKFTATASLGVIHRGREREALQLMATYLPKDASSSSAGSAYQEGGGLYALGLIHANHGGAMADYLLAQLKGASSEVVRHGAALGLGLAAMGTARQDAYDALKATLDQDDAVAGEACGLALGLVMLGSRSPQAVQDMVGYARDTRHEKILRGLAVGVALVMYGCAEEADGLVAALSRDKCPVLRRAAMYATGMAYVGTGSNRAARRLLHVAVSDVSDDVRRAAIESLGFVMFRAPEQCHSVVALLAESYNPHVRCGAAMALGICCAGTGNKEAVALLEPMANDPVNYVRQGALVASALVAVQQTDATCPRAGHLRALYAKVIADKHDDVMAKFGAILAQGIVDAGGRNATVQLASRAGHTHAPTVVGLLVFTQFWFWFPLAHFLSLAFTPTAVVGLNRDLRMPKVKFLSACKPSVFGYPPPLKVAKEKEREKVSTAVLSITAKAKKKEREKKERDAGDDRMEVDPAAGGGGDAHKKEKTTTTTTEAAEKKSRVEPAVAAAAAAEPGQHLLENPARVMPAQLRVLGMPDGCRYRPYKPLASGGVVMLRDTASAAGLGQEAEEELVEPVSSSLHGGPGGVAEEDEGQEPEPPEPFEYVDE